MNSERRGMGIQYNRGDNKLNEDKPDYNLIERIMSIFSNRFVSKYGKSKHANRNKMSQTESFLQKDAAKKKRKRKIAYQSRKINRIRKK